MRKSLMMLLFAASASLSATAAMAADPTPDQIYATAESGRLDQARAMVAEVLKDHPNSAKAHYVAAEVDARSGLLPDARQEFQTAEKIEPGLPFAKAGSVAELRAELFPSQAATAPVVRTVSVPAYAAAPVSHSHFPLGTVLGIGFVVLVIWLLVRRRYVVAPVGGPVYGGPRGPMDGGYGYGYGGPGYGGYPPGGGMGSGIVGGLASGLAVGAGVVAGEELAHRLMDGGENRTVEYIDPVQPQDPGAGQNADMGGNDFGINDGNSWDDSSGGGDFGGGGDNSW